MRIYQAYGNPDRHTPLWGGAEQRREALYYRDRYTCQYCGNKTDALNIEHMIPRSRFNTDHPSNLTTACHRCNVLKWCYTVKEWREVTAKLSDGHPKKIVINPLIGKYIHIVPPDEDAITAVITTTLPGELIAVGKENGWHFYLYHDEDALELLGDCDEFYELAPLPTERAWLAEMKQRGITPHARFNHGLRGN